MKKLFSILLTITALFIMTNAIHAEEKEDKPDTWIADRKITGLVFQSDGDVSAEMNPEIAAELKRLTGIELELQGISGESSLDALTAGLAAGDLPDFIAYYLNNSGRPEMQVLTRASEQGRLHDISDLLKETEIYSKYFEEDYLPQDSRENIVFRNGLDGEVYLVHMSINREGGVPNRKFVGGPYIRADIAQELDIDPQSINTTDELKSLVEEIKAHGFLDDNGNEVYPIGPTIWGGSDRESIFQDIVWSGSAGEKIRKDGDEYKHESQTEYAMKRVQFVRDLLSEDLMHPEYFTMEENRAKEGMLNGSFAIIGEMHNYTAENIQDMRYVPLGPINYVDGSDTWVLPYKSGYAGWSIPSSTENPEDIVKLADFLASREGKLLYWYGIEGRDYELDDSGNPIVKQEVLDLIESNPAEAKKLGFRGVGSYWGEHLGYTDIAWEEDFGESDYGQNSKENFDESTPQKIIDIYDYDRRLEEAEVVDGVTPRTFVNEFENSENLEIALNEYLVSLQRAYFAGSDKEAEDIVNEALKKLENAGINDYFEMLKELEANGTSIRE